MTHFIVLSEQQCSAAWAMGLLDNVIEAREYEVEPK
jgi:hypothetical protein